MKTFKLYRRLTNSAIFSMSVFAIASVFAIDGYLNNAFAESKTANIPIESQQVQEYKVIHNTEGQNYVLLQNTATGEFYATDHNMNNCDFWKDKGVGTHLKMNELTRNASYGKFKELAAIDGDACVGIYPSRIQITN